MSNEYEQPVEPMSRTEDLLRTGTEEPVIAMSRIEKILRGEKITPQSRIEDLLLKYNPSDILIEKSVTENGTYYARIDNADGYYKVVVDTPVVPPTVLEHLVETISTNGTHTFTPGTGVDGYSDATITVDVPANVMSRGLQVNGTFASSVDNKDGYSNVTVNVQEAPVKTTSLTVTENGTYEPDPASEVSLTIPTIPDEVETDVSAGADITNFDNLRIDFTNKTTGATGHVDIYPSAIAIQQIPMSFKDRTLIMGPDGDHYITLVNGYDSIVVLQKGYTITEMKLTSYSGYFDEVNVNVESGGGTIVNGEILTDNSFTNDFQLFSEGSMSNTTTAGGKANITWNGGTSIGYCKCGKTAYRNAKKIKVHIDYYGDSYGHQHTNNRNWNFAVFVTDIQLTSAVTLTNFVSDPHCLDYIECDNNQYYGKTNLDFEIDLSEITDPVYISFQSPGVTIQGLKITMVYEDEGDLYKYLWSSDEKICIREGIGEIKWFFNGYVTDSGEDPYPQEFKQFIPSGALQGGVILGPAYSTSAATEQVGWIGFYRNKIRVWSMDKGNLITGTFYGVVDALDSSAEQHEVYKDPLDIPDIDISVIEKTITANGTYSAEDDGYVGYSDVSVNVPLPQNAYLLKSVANLPQAIASFNDGEEMVMPSLKVAIEPQQDLHGYDSPWVGGAGKNKCDLSAFTHTGVVDDEGGETTLNNRLFSVHIPVKSGTTYTLSLTGSKNGENIYANRIIYFDSNDTFIKRYTPASQIQAVSFTTLSNAKYIQIDLRTVSLLGIEITDISKIQVEEGDSATAYAPYSNICPISGWDEVNVTVCGKNLFDVSKTTAYKVMTENGEVDNGAYSHSDYIKVLPNTLYFLSNIEASTGISIFCNYDENKNFIGYSSKVGLDGRLRQTLTNTAYIVVNFKESIKNEMMICMSSIEETYEPYNGATYTIDLDGTRYGGEVDVVNGTMTVDRGYVDLGTLNWSKTSLEATILFIAISDKKEMSPMMCSKYKYVRDKGFGLDFGTISDSSNTSYIDYIFVRNQDFSGKTTTECASILNGTQLVYELATPQTIQLTPTAVKSLLGSNNIWADTGDITDAEYFSQVDVPSGS